MYCKKCGKNYPKEKKVCSSCGIVLSPGDSPVDPAKKRKRLLIAAAAVAVVFVAVFLYVGLTGMVPSALKGTWYDQAGQAGTLNFKPSGELQYNVGGTDGKGTYTFDSTTGKGTLAYTGLKMEPAEFTCDGAQIIMDEMVFTHTVVEQFDMGSLFDSLQDQG